MTPVVLTKYASSHIRAHQLYRDLTLSHISLRSARWIAIELDLAHATSYATALVGVHKSRVVHRSLEAHEYDDNRRIDALEKPVFVVSKSLKCAYRRQ